MSGAEPELDEAGELLLQLPPVKFYAIVGGSKTLLCEEELNVLQVGAITFFVVGDYTCPLSKTLPSLMMSTAYFVFPLPDAFYGVEITDADTRQKETWEKILEEYSLLRRANLPQPVAPTTASYPAPSRKVDLPAHVTDVPKSTEIIIKPKESSTNGEKVEKVGKEVAEGIEKSGKLVAGGLTAAATTLGAGMQWGSHWVKSKIKPNEKPVEVSERLEGNLMKARQFSGVAVKVSAALVTAVVGMTSQVASQIAQEVKSTDTGKKIDKTLGGNSDDTSAKSHPAVSALKEVAVSTMVAAGEIQSALFQAGVTLVDKATEATADVVEHKYGEHVGRVTRTGAAVVTDTAKAAANMGSVGPKQIAQSVAKKTAANIVMKDDQVSRAMPEQIMGAEEGEHEEHAAHPPGENPGKSSVVIEEVQE